MKQNKFLEYTDKKTIIHELTGATKLICFLLLSFASMLTFDIRVISIILIFSLIVMKISKTTFKEISIALVYIVIFLIMNMILTFIFSPQNGVEIYGSKHVIFMISERYTLTYEQLFYQVSKLLKYISLVPYGLLLFITTDPSEFASSLNKIGVNYKICTTLSLTLRYFPDVQTDFKTISQAEQARGIDMSKNAKLSKRFKAVASILIPLLFTTLDRIEIVSNAMELRSFGKKDKRTWYNSKDFTKKDYLAMLISFLFLAFSLYVRFFINKSIYYNPFI